MTYILENLKEFERLEKQSQFTNYDYRKELADFKFKANAKILDAGCGSGIVSRHIASTHSDAKIIAVDFSQERIELARHAAKHLSNISFAQADLTKLDLQDNSFDHIICRFVLQHLKIDGKNQLALAELYRVLKPGGTLLVIESDGLMKNLYPQSDFLRECLNKLDREGPVDFDIGRKIPTMMEEAGFEIITTDIVACPCRKQQLVEEITLMTERLATAHNFLTEFFLGEEYSSKFSREYINIMKHPNSIYYFSKFLTLGTKTKTTNLKVLK